MGLDILKGFGKKQWLIVLLLGILAFAIRAHLMRYELFFEFDSYFHARIIGTLLQTGSIPVVDTMAYYFGQFGMPLVPVFWYFSAAIYKIIFLGAAYSKANVILLVKFLPAFYGALTAMAMYFLGKEIYSKKAGYAMAFVAAVSPAFIYRTMSGFFEDDCLGFLWLGLGFLFMVRALKSTELNKTMILNTALAGIFFGIMAWSWGMYLLIPIIIIPFFVLALARALWIKSNRELLLFAGSFAAMIVIFSIISLPLDWVPRALSYVQQAIGGTGIGEFFPVLAIIAAIYVLLALKAKKNSDKIGEYSKFTSIILLIVIVGAILFTLFMFATQAKIFENPGVLGSSVGEENTGHQFFGSKYNFLLVLPALALILLPIRIWREKKDYFSIMMFIWILVTLVMAWYKLKFTFVFGLSLAPAAAVVAEELFHYTKNRPKIDSKIVFLGFAFLLLTGLAAGITFTKTNIPNIEYSFPNWKPALNWISTETPADAKMFNWWNQGHWISFMGERAVLNDNRNLSKESDQDFALFYITPDLNTAIRLVDRYKSDYVIFDISDFQSMISMGQYAFDTTNGSDPRILPYYLIDSQGRGMQGAIFQACSIVDSGQKVTCGQNSFAIQDWYNLPAVWQKEPNNFYEQRVPIFIYRDTVLPVLYVFNEASNNSTAVKLWFNEPETMKFFEESYGKEGIKIFKIKKDEIAKELKK